MKNLFKGKLAIGFVICATVILAGVTVFTAIRLYQTSTESGSSIFPNSQTTSQEAEIVSARELSFVIRAQETLTPSPTTAQVGTPTPTISPAATATQMPVKVLTPSPTIIASTPTIATSTPTQTTAAQLPDAGIGLPTILGFTIGSLFIYFSLVILI